MKLLKKLAKLTIICAVCSAPLAAHAAHPNDTLSLNIYFRLNSAAVEEDYRDNSRSLDAFTGELERIRRDTNMLVKFITVETFASPSGDIQRNEILALNRARNIKEYISRRMRLDPATVKTFAGGVNWEGLRREISEATEQTCPWRKEILETIDRHGILNDYDIREQASCKAELMSIDRGKAWKWMTKNIFDNLRNCYGTVSYMVYRKIPEIKTSCPECPLSGIDINAIRDIASSVAEQTAIRVIEEYRRRNAPDSTRRVWKNDSLFRSPVMALRTNLLLPALNLGLEVCENNRWSTAADIYYPWAQRSLINRWYSTNTACLQIEAGYLTQYVWLGKNHKTGRHNGKYRLKGHAIGLVLGAARFDVERNGEGSQGEAGAIGLEYRASLPLGKKGRVMLGFEIAGGYVTYREHRYTVGKDNPDDTRAYSDNGYGNRGRKSGQTLAPLKAGISLTIPLANKKWREEK